FFGRQGFPRWFVVAVVVGWQVPVVLLQQVGQRGVSLSPRDTLIDGGFVAELRGKQGQPFLPAHLHHQPFAGQRVVERVELAQRQPARRPCFALVVAVDIDRPDAESIVHPLRRGQDQRRVVVVPAALRLFL